MHFFPKSDENEIPFKIGLYCVGIDEVVHSLYDVISSCTVSNAVHLPGDQAIETSVVVRPVRSHGKVKVGCGRFGGEESCREVRELDAERHYPICSQLG